MTPPPPILPLKRKLLLDQWLTLGFGLSLMALGAFYSLQNLSLRQSQLIRDFLTGEKQRQETISSEYVRDIAQLYQAGMEKSARILIKKDQESLARRTQAGSPESARRLLTRTLSDNPEILLVSLFFRKNRRIEAWQYADRARPSGLSMPMTYDFKTRRWISSSRSARPRSLPDPDFPNALHKINPGTSEDFQFKTVLLPDQRGALIPTRVVEAIAPIKPRGYLRYLFSLDVMDAAIAAEATRHRLRISQLSSEEVRFEKLSADLIRRLFKEVTFSFLGGAVLIFLVSLGLSEYLSRRFVQPIVRLTEIARKMAQGDYSQEFRITQNDEIGLLAGAFNQMTKEIRHRDHSLQASRERLEKSEGRFRTLFLQAPDAILVYDPWGDRFVDANESAEKLFACGRQELLREKPESFYPKEKEAAASLKSQAAGQISRVLTGEKLLLEQPIENAAGKMLDCEVRLTTLPGDQKQMIRASYIDITQRKLFERNLSQAKDEAEKLSRIKGEFLDIAAHELRTPLTSITLFLGLLKSQSGPEIVMTATQLEKVYRQVRRLSRLVDDLLNTSRLERGGFTLHRIPVDIVQLIREIMKDFRNQTPSRVVHFDAPSQPIQLDVDPDRIYQLIGNLLENILKYTPENSSVDVHISDLEGKVRVALTDHGPGIPSDKRDQLFTRFYRIYSDSTLNQPGLGLGLYICRRIAELHGGTMGMKDELDGGNTFYFEIPRKLTTYDAA
jgi:PAS domain S-box-containing protein